MNEQMSLERLVAGWMADEATGAPAPLLEQILETTARTAPQSRLWARLAERPMASPTMRVAVGLPNRGLVYATILALLLAALAGLAVGAYLLLQPRPIETGDWAGFRGDAERSGVALQGPIGNPVVAWQFHAPGAVLEVAIIGDRAYFASDDGTLHAVSRDRGIEQWTATIANAPLTGPYAADGRIYLSDAGGVFHAFRQTDGSAIWTSPASYDVPSRLISADGTLYFGTSDGLVVALDGATGAERWRLRPTGATHVDAPAFADGRLFAGTDGAGFVAIDTASHQVLWAGDTDGEDTGSATVADGIAYIGASAEATAAGTLHAFDAATGRPLWTAAGPWLGLPAVANGVAYSASVHGLLAAIDTRTGRTLWADQLPGDLRPPALVGGVIFISAGVEHRVYAVDAATGHELWHVEIDAYANCCIAVAKGRVFVGTQSGSVYAIGGDGAAVAARPFPSVAASVGPAPSASVGPTATPLSSIGTIAWSVDLKGMGFAPISQIAVDPTTGRIWAPEANADRIAIFGADGKLLEEWGGPGDGPGQFDFTRGNGDGYGTLAFAKDGSFYVLDVGNRRVQQFDPKRRFVRAWGSFGNRPGEYTDPVGIAVAPDGTVWVLDDVRSVVEHYTRDGDVLGSFDPFENTPITSGANSLATDPQGNLYVSGAQPSQVSVFDPGGTFLRFVGDDAFDDQATNMAIDAAGHLFVTQGAERGSTPGVLVFGADGARIGGFGPTGTGEGQLVFPAGIALDGKGGLYVEDSIPESARLVRIDLAPPFLP